MTNLSVRLQRLSSPLVTRLCGSGSATSEDGPGFLQVGVTPRYRASQTRGILSVLGSQLQPYTNRTVFPHGLCRALSSLNINCNGNVLSSNRPGDASLNTYRHTSGSAPAAAGDAASSSVGTRQLPRRAKVVVCGGGVIGCSIAYHLAKEGWTDVALLEQGSLTCGTTWHAAGLIGCLRGAAVDAAMCSYSSQLYKQLQDEGYYTGWKSCGSMNLARTRDRVIAYDRALLNARRFGVEGEFLSAEQVKERLPVLNTEDLEGGFWIPTDGVASPPDVALAMAKKAKEMGVSIIEACQVKSVLTKNEKVTGVETSLGTVECQYFVNSAGMWSRQLGQLSNPKVRVPLHPCEHYYIVTKAVEGVDPLMPVVRDYDGHVYLREWGGGIMGGGFEPKGKPVFHNGIPDKFEHQLLPEDWDHFQVLLEQLLHRMPALSEAQVRQLTNGPESFTPDAKYIMGRSPEMVNYFVAAGMNSSGIAGAGGVGKVMAEWIIQGEPSMNLWSNDIRRFVDLHNNIKFLKDRVAETLGWQHKVTYWETESVGLESGRKLRTSPLYTRMETNATFGQGSGYERPLYFSYSSDSKQDAEDSATAFNTDLSSRSISEMCNHAVASPQAEYETGRRLRCSTIYPRLQAKKGMFGQYVGAERSLWFDTKQSQDDFPDDTKGSFGKPVWFDRVKSEYWACREGVCLIDMSTFTKFELRSAGEEVVKFLQHMCSNDVDRPVGTIIHTGMQNEHGGYENDCSVVRLETNRYFMISPTAQQTRSFAWLKHHLPEDGSVQLTDVTSMYTAINVLGPKSPELLGELTDATLSKPQFGHMTCQEIDVGQASGIKAMRLTHSGEEGWMLYIPSEYALHVYDSLMSAGANYGIRNAGYYALRALRTEKFYAYWGTDLTPHVTPLECGREFRVKLDTGGFIGYEALVKQRETGVKKRLVQFFLEDHDVHNDIWAWGGEPIYRNGIHVGNTTSTAYGFTLQKFICLGYVQDQDEQTGELNNITTDYLLKNAKYEINIAGEKFVAKPAIYPPKLPPAGIVVD